jgi:hypothetical protein
MNFLSGNIYTGLADLTVLKRYAKQTVDDLRAVHAATSPVDRAGI